MAFLEFFELLFKSKVFFIGNGILKGMPNTGSQRRISSKIGRMLLFEWGFGLFDVLRIHLGEKGKLEENIKKIINWLEMNDNKQLMK
jgi:hypothetical protein